MGHEALAGEAAAGRITAAALAVDVTVPEQFSPPWPDGVRVVLETAGYARIIYRPYRIITSGLLRRTKSVEYAEMFAVEGPHHIFPRSPA
jgi:hypothetical protein